MVSKQQTNLLGQGWAISVLRATAFSVDRGSIQENHQV